MNIKTDYKYKKIEVFHKETAESTNTEAKLIAKDGAVVIADRQTKGRGRLGRTFLSEKGGIYLSIFLNLKETLADALFLTSAAAVAVSETLDGMTGEETLIKWVNDIYLDGKKVCGILAESNIQNGKIESAVLGIGVNLIKTFEFEGELKEKAGFVFDSGDFLTLRKEFCENFFYKFFALLYEKRYEEIRKTYNEKNYLLRKTVFYNINGEEHSGTVTGIDENINLAVSENGKERKLSFGEVNLSLNHQP